MRIDNTALLDATGLDLQFLLDGSTGSTVVLDNILFPGLINGDFQSGNLTQWNVSTTGTGSIGIAQVASLVPMDIKPETCPNDFNTGKKGSFPVAILGMEHFDVSNVDVSSIRLQGGDTYSLFGKRCQFYLRAIWR